MHTHIIVCHNYVHGNMMMIISNYIAKLGNLQIQITKKGQVGCKQQKWLAYHPKYVGGLKNPKFRVGKSVIQVNKFVLPNVCIYLQHVSLKWCVSG